MMEKRSKNIFLLLIFMLCLLTMFFVSMQLFVLVFKNSNPSPSSFLLGTFSDFNPLTNKTKHGFVTLSTPLENEDFISFNTGDHFISITNIFSYNYECSASCYCSNSRRNLALSKPMFFVSSAISSIMAVSIAKKYFESTCFKKYGKTRGTNSFTSKNGIDDYFEEENVDMEFLEMEKNDGFNEIIEQCEENEIVTDFEGCHITDASIDKKRELKSSEDTLFRTYRCKGRCFDNPDIGKELKEVQKDFDCSKIKLDLNVDMDSPLRSHQYNSPNDWEWRYQSWNEAIHGFVEILSDVCKKRSEHSVKVKSKNGKYAKYKRDYLCLGHWQYRKIIAWCEEVESIDGKL